MSVTLTLTTLDHECNSVIHTHNTNTNNLQAATKQNAFRTQELDASNSNVKEALSAINDKMSRLDHEDKRVGVGVVWV
jgi:hypothetical protein